MYHIAHAKINDVWFFIALDDGRHLVTCSFSARGYKEAFSDLLSHLPPNSEIKETYADDYSSKILQTLNHIYEGKKVEITFPLSLQGIPAFTRKALEATMEIPRGYVTSYGEIARRLGNRGASRAVGRAEATNPLPLLIPCHRVVKSTLETGEYGGGRKVKCMLLEREGTYFTGKRVSRKSLWTFKP